MAQHDDLFILIEPFDDLAGKHSLAGAGWRFYDEFSVLVYDRRKVVDELLLPISELHRRAIAKEMSRSLLKM